jgi:hypothetical protein
MLPFDFDITSWRWLLRWLTVVGGGLTFGAGGISLWVEIEINRRNAVEMLRLRKDVAEANERAEKERLARVELERRTSVRALVPEELKRVEEAVAKFAGQRAEVVVFPVTFESSWIAGTIQGILSNAKWDVTWPITLLPAPPNGFLVQGVHIQPTPDAGSKAAAHALHEALKTTVAGGSLSPDFGQINAAKVASGGKPLVWIFVGDRPTPLSTWVQ